MNLMEKFSAVEIKADNRISEGDKAFCLRQQEAFDKAGPALQKVAEAMAAAKAEQTGILTADDDFIDRYVGNDCDVDSVYDTMKKRNRTFISAASTVLSWTRARLRNISFPLARRSRICPGADIGT